jgi:hypothetical protein
MHAAKDDNLDRQSQQTVECAETANLTDDGCWISNFMPRLKKEIVNHCDLKFVSAPEEELTANRASGSMIGLSTGSGRGQASISSVTIHRPNQQCDQAPFGLDRRVHTYV